MHGEDLRPVDSVKDRLTTFVDGKYYGASFEIETKEELDGLLPCIRAGLCIPQPVGELVLWRQEMMMQLLNIMIEGILDQGSTTRTREKTTEKAGGSGADHSFQTHHSTSPCETYSTRPVA